MVAKKEWTWLPLPTPSIWVPADNGKVIEHLSILHFLFSSLRIYEATLPPKIHFVVVVDKQAFPYLWISLVLLNLSIDNGSIVRPAGQWGTLSLIWCRRHFTCGDFCPGKSIHGLQILWLWPQPTKHKCKNECDLSLAQLSLFFLSFFPCVITFRELCP